MSCPPILRGTTKASSCGWRVPILFSSKKLNGGRTSILALFGSEWESSDDSLATNITLEGWEPILPSATKMTLMVPSEGLEEVFPRAPDLDWSPCPLGRYRNCCNFPSLTSCSRWFHVFYSPRWYVPSLGGIGNEGFGCASKGLHSFCSATWSMTRFLSSPKIDAQVLWTQC